MLTGLHPSQSLEKNHKIKIIGNIIVLQSKLTNVRVKRGNVIYKKGIHAFYFSSYFFVTFCHFEFKGDYYSSSSTVIPVHYRIHQHTRLSPISTPSCCTLK